MVLVKHLPRDSAVNRELHGEAAEWSVTDHLLAAAVDHLAAANWMFACVNTDEDAEPPERPEPVPRPGDDRGDPDDADDGDDRGVDLPYAEGEGDAARDGDGPDAVGYVSVDEGRAQAVAAQSGPQGRSAPLPQALVRFFA